MNADMDQLQTVNEGDGNFKSPVTNVCICKKKKVYRCLDVVCAFSY